MELVDHMIENPGNCILCQGTTIPAVHAEGIDVNWGDDVYICNECCHLIGDLVGRASAEEREELKKVKGELEDLKNRHSELHERLSKIVAGRKAEKAQRAA